MVCMNKMIPCCEIYSTVVILFIKNIGVNLFHVLISISISCIYRNKFIQISNKRMYNYDKNKFMPLSNKIYKRYIITL